MLFIAHEREVVKVVLDVNAMGGGGMVRRSLPHSQASYCIARLCVCVCVRPVCVCAPRVCVFNAGGRQSKQQTLSLSLSCARHNNPAGHQRQEKTNTRRQAGPSPGSLWFVYFYFLLFPRRRWWRWRWFAFAVADVPTADVDTKSRTF